MLENQVMADAASNEQIPTLELSIVMPCLNEAETLATCIGKARDYLERHKIAGEVLIADNGSSDGSQEIATNSGARVVPIPERGYGSALRGGIAAAKGQYIIMGDADDSYDFTNLSPFLEKLRQGYDLVMGNRFQGGIKPGAMPVLHKHLGNPVLTWLGRLFFGSPCGDFHCGLRGFSKQAIEQLNLRTTGMEFASEMVVKASLYGLKITEVPTTLSPDGRSRPPHLKTWRDGWRHLRFLLMYSPRWLFLYPGLALMFLGFVATIWFIPQPKVHTLLYSATALIIGFQIVSFAIFTKAFAISEGLLPEDRKLRRFLRYINLEVGLIIGVILFLVGIGGSVYALYTWNAQLYGALNPAVTMRIVIPSVTALALGVQVVFSSFFLSVLGLKRR
ncbi:MAG: glycosyltransferase family 2 protein [Microcystis aeruginosa Ma_MB_F_20061100_S19]|uniref:Undecaprenyl-phosphate 4-deoxy-4-formamido-L-arabinose transferase n=1 Tax=Microcystis aeruginosa SPC777 TaxID=482300 RepID=S3JAI8_MICAE|nr:glycosyltransferase family 2 protein [Microcystis aeruginosa]NCR97907.1 glycosyltransferase family 2 protein [Microcystis aeruginosa L311-01]OCY13940.1 MAG: dolichol-P-glucose synthetase [Microcystis aeruginosa CACIAM 03]TRU05803.1 MAG: glycosyltransferase family 2 protein [Microcystis aeruginosa Ma_MB_F_20061100_S19D]TRU17112.1 MAG: glycosyltransferase family 2 protein [Microcystis aeruginosa Ma_MB_F_20061100_S19]EPF22768.1 Undecaprenyl-phosphate 4-deoxy-4-formamido-L-arabinose transferase